MSDGDTVSTRPELTLYAEITGTDHVHFGYWDDPSYFRLEKWSFDGIRRAQERYAHRLLQLLATQQDPILDAGCGMGGTAALLTAQGHEVTALTPDAHQIAYVRQKHPEVPTIRSRFEDLLGTASRDATALSSHYGTVLMAESFQYMNPKRALEVAHTILRKDGDLLIADYFVHEKSSDPVSRSGHELEPFLESLKPHGFALTEKIDITENVLPTLKILQHLAAKVGRPLFDFAEAKFRRKRPLLYRLSRRRLKRFRKKLEAQTQLLDPDAFRRAKEYCIILASRRGGNAGSTLPPNDSEQF